MFDELYVKPTIIWRASMTSNYLMQRFAKLTLIAEKALQKLYKDSHSLARY